MVKREDEQAFAELNAANPIFVEDAVRAFAGQLIADPRVGDFRVVASHQESLHSHDAVSLLTSGPTFAQASLDPATFAGCAPDLRPAVAGGAARPPDPLLMGRTISARMRT